MSLQGHSDSAVTLLLQTKAQSVISLFEEPLQYGHNVTMAKFLSPDCEQINSWFPCN